ncbi:hypothetical protein LCGC14_0611600, partial [marine sediment metagenome]
EGLEVFIVSCPKDLTMFEDALKTSGFEGQFVVRELIELINDCVEYDDSIIETQETAEHVAV